MSPPIPVESIRVLTRFAELAASIALNHRLGRPSRSLDCYTAETVALLIGARTTQGHQCVRIPRLQVLGFAFAHGSSSRLRPQPLRVCTS